MELRVSVEVRGDSIRVDFDGSADQVPGNLNCPLAVTRAAVRYAVRVLTDPDAPPSAGAYRPIEIAAAEGSVLNARPGAAVAAGNVETSSRVADLVLAALGEAAGGPAQGQGTMNNLTLSGGEGDAAFTYYETLGGGQGACARRARAERGPRGDVEHAQHSGRGARGRAAGPRSAARGAARQRR